MTVFRYLLILFFLSGCSLFTKIEKNHFQLQPNIVSDLKIPIYIKSYNLMVITPKIMRYIDAAQYYLELHEPSIERSRVVVYPRHALFRKKLRIIGEVPYVVARGKKGRREIKVEWDSKRGAWGYADARLKEAGWTYYALLNNDLPKKATAAAEDAIKDFVQEE